MKSKMVTNFQSLKSNNLNKAKIESSYPNFQTPNFTADKLLTNVKSEGSVSAE